MTIDQLRQLLDYDTAREVREIDFCIEGDTKFSDCWMGRLFDGEAQRDILWFGLTPDGSYAFEYAAFGAMINDPVFDGKSLSELWNRVDIRAVNGMSPQYYLDRK